MFFVDLVYVMVVIYYEWFDFFLQLFLMYVGFVLNVRVERVLCDCFRDGGVLVELMILFENISEGDLKYYKDRDKEVDVDVNYKLVIKVFYW